MEKAQQKLDFFDSLREANSLPYRGLVKIGTYHHSSDCVNQINVPFIDEAFSKELRITVIDFRRFLCYDKTKGRCLP